MTHRKVEGLVPLPTGWRVFSPIVEMESGNVVEVDCSPIAALAHVSEWDCNGPKSLCDGYGNTCNSHKQSEVHDSFYPVWAEGYSIVGDAFILDDDDNRIIRGPGEDDVTLEEWLTAQGDLK